jgi:predicted membrane protein
LALRESYATFVPKNQKNYLQMKRYTSTSFRAAVTGLLIVAAGVLLIMFNNGMLPLEYRPVVFSWPSLLCTFGFLCLLNRRRFWFGLALLLVGGFFLLPKLDGCGFESLRGNGWAVALIVAGVAVVVHSTYFHRQHQHWVRLRKKIADTSYEYDCRYDYSYPPRSRSHTHLSQEAGNVDYTVVFTSRHQKFDHKEFSGGEITCVFGGVDFDLSEAQLTEGEHRLEINCVFGGVMLYLPIDWRVVLHQSAVFGNFVDNRPAPSFAIDEKKVLILDVTAVFGGGEVKVMLKE